jgi:hypothetical protein
MMSKSKMKYVFDIPTAVPAGRVLVHNVIPHKPKTVPRTNDFRAWFDILRDDYVICSCGWAAHIGTHYCEAPIEEVVKFWSDKAEATVPSTRSAGLRASSKPEAERP